MRRVLVEALQPKGVRARAPGKLILMGEHAAVYGSPAVVAAIECGVTVQLRRTETKKVTPTVVLDLERESSQLPWSEIESYTVAARRHWQAVQDDKVGPFVPLSPTGESIDHANRLIALALGEAWRTLKAALGSDATPPSLELEMRSELPIGSGFGSSAAVSSAVVAACLALCRGASDPPDLAEVQTLALAVERHQHGSPSGVDTAAVAGGGRLWVERSESGRLTLKPVQDQKALLSKLEVWDTGAPLQSTGEVVSAVRSLRRRDLLRFGRALGSIEDATVAFRAALESGASAALAASIRQAGAALVELEVVPAPVRQVLDQLSDLGGSAKISGAGALSGDAAGALLVYHPTSAQRELFESSGYRRFETRVGAPGLEWKPIELTPG